MSFKQLFNSAMRQDYASTTNFVNYVAMFSFEANVSISQILDSMVIDSERLNHHNRHLSLMCYHDAHYSIGSIWDDSDLANGLINVALALDSLCVPTDLADRTAVLTMLRRLALAWEDDLQPHELTERVDLGSVFEEQCLLYESNGNFVDLDKDEEVLELMQDLANSGIRGYVPTSTSDAMHVVYSTGEIEDDMIDD